ncbi:cytochrome c oxidase subunit 7A1, mitochondrial-like [Neopsephotus bourkii]|uniref:cytochrome c oxidase subunit 7A1, mitochondrial-like n=1 Tax=Neopsephotus bourkii TaxID=309878 RepID=UPI002AA56BD6|nr:cytochrome c oxidase subunit 7A1, mitochondrial-like [Neopsephotus bourkii]
MARETGSNRSVDFRLGLWHYLGLAARGSQPIQTQRRRKRSPTPPPRLLRSLSPAAPPRHLHNRVREHQKLFQEDNGLPVYLKGGAMDSALFRLTSLICTGGTCYSLWCLGQASRAKKP